MDYLHGQVDRALTFELLRARFQFRATRFAAFPERTTGNFIRSAFGSALKRVACAPDCESARACEARDSCAYARIFEPGDAPRPFVLRAAHLEGQRFAPGAEFHFDLHLFNARNPERGSYEAALANFRGVAELVSCTYTPVAVSLEPERRNVSRVEVIFKTPMELKAGRALAPSPEFAILFARTWERIDALRAAYGAGPLETDCRATAARVRMTRCDLRRIEARRRSGSTGQTHSIGGLAGEAEYEGDLDEFLPCLRAAAWTGVGRQTVWGKGEIEVREIVNKQPGG